MSDWTTARVVRDCYGDLWGSDADNPGAWTRLGCDWADAEPERELERDCGPLTPILNADGLPVVRTVGDLTARHLGREVHVEGMRRAVLLAMRQPLPDEPLVALLVRVYGDITSTDYLTLDTPCELLPEGDA